ncbi:MAG TPA: amidohydrolase family protein, partial [Dehalococcoidia bacterium]|nr:amidohydrolase family protein [Dehalococcoidia bacterium]
MRLDAHAHIIPEDCTQLTFQDPEGRTHGVNARLRPDGSWDLEVDGLPRSPNDTSVEKPFQDWFVHSFDLERRFHYLDQLGIDAQVVATPHFLYPHAAEPSLGLAMAQRINNSLAKIASAHPQRLLVLATVPLQDPPAAIRELERAIDTLGLKGVVIDCNINGKNLDEAEFRDFFAKAEALQAPIFVHPRYSPNQPGMSRYHLANMVGVAM